jgi:salicylate hydroxylase
VLKALGLANAVIRNGTQIERLYGKSCESGRAVLDVRYSDMREGGASGLGVHRAALFDALFQAVVDMGILIETDSEVQSSRLLPSGQRTLGLLDGREEEPFDLIVDALGSRSPLLKRSRRALPYGALWATVDWPANSGFEPAALEQRYRGARNMEGLLPIGRIPGDPKEKAAFFWSLKIDNLAAWEAARLQKLKRDILQIWPEISVVIDQLTVPNQLTFAS